MQMSTYLPPSATQWEEVLTFRDLPILSETRDSLRLALRDPQVSFETLVPIAERDPALCWHLLQSAITQNPGCQEQLSGAYSCLSLLGMQELVRLVKSLPTIDKDSTRQSEQLYRQALYTAHMAGCLAAQWASVKGASTKMAHWSSMLAHSVLWPWLLVDEASANWLHCLSEGDDIMTAARKVFGNSPKNWQRLVRRHNLPDAVTRLFREDALPDFSEWKQLRRHDPRDMDNGRRLIHQSQTPSMLALAAAGTAWHLHINPEGKRSKRWLELSSHALGRQLPSVLKDCRAIQLQEANLRKSAQVSGMGLLASPQIEHMHYPAWSPQASPVDVDIDQTEVPVANEAASKQPQTTPTSLKTRHQGASLEIEAPVSAIATSSIVDKATQPKDKVPTATTNSAYLKKLMQQLDSEPASFGDWHYLMQGALKGISNGINIQHACIVLPDKQRQSLRAVYSENPEGIDAIIKMRIVLDSAPLFRQLMKKTAALHVTPANREQYFKGLPLALREALPQEMVIMSIAAGGSPIGIVIATSSSTQGGSSTPIQEEQYKAFKQLCNVTSRGLSSLRKMRQAQPQQQPQQRAARSG